MKQREGDNRKNSTGLVEEGDSEGGEVVCGWSKERCEGEVKKSKVERR